VTDQCTAQSRSGLALLLVRALELGLQGSIEHAEFYAEYSGEVGSRLLRGTRNGAEERVPDTAYTIKVLVPRPEPLPCAPAVPRSSPEGPRS
jgi:hypothetical protein